VRIKRTVFALIASAPWLIAQEIKLPPAFEALASKAREVGDINLDASTLAAASKSLARQGQQGQTAELLKNLKQILVRSYKFDQPAQYSSEDLEQIRGQLQQPVWTPVVRVRKRAERGEETDIYVMKEADKVVGLTILAAEPTELTLVQILGPIELDKLSALGPALKIPNLRFSPATPRATGEKK